MAPKREDENGHDDGPLSKKPRVDGAASAGDAKTAVMEKARKALELKKELAEKLQKLKALKQQAQPAGAATAGAPAAPAGTDAAAKVAAGIAKAAQLASRFGVEVAPGPAAPLASATPSVAIGAGAGGAAFKPPALRLDAQGREVDEFGNLLAKPAAPVATLKVNQHVGRPPAGGATSVMPPLGLQQDLQGAPPPPPQEDAFFDPRMGDRGLRKLERRARPTFEFVQEGEFQKQAEMFRLQARYGRDALPPPKAPRGPIGPQGPALGDPNQVPLGHRSVTPGSEGGADSSDEEEQEEEEEEEVIDVPEVEWWDKALLPHASYAQDVEPALEAGQPVTLKENKITLYVEHPVPIEPPAEEAPPPPQPLKLTTKELKKLRTQRRLAREKEKQELIRQGLLEPSKPKVKLSNLYRVLGEQAVADPTMLELETKKQMAERQAAHEDRNLARALTPAEKREKKLRKLFDDSGVDVIASVYRVGRLDTALNRFKVEVNAKENHMSGVALITPELTLVVVEGCKKSTKRYAKLMLRRIDWSLPPAAPRGAKGAGEEGGAGAGGEEEGEGDEEGVPNSCHLVWQGLVKKAAFEGFRVETCSTVDHAQQVLVMRGVSHYWDAAKNYVPGEAPEFELV